MARRCLTSTNEFGNKSAKGNSCMNPIFSKFLFYLPVTMAKGENVLGLLPEKRDNQTMQRDALMKYQVERLRDILKTAQSQSEFHSRLNLADMPPRGCGPEEFLSWFKTVPTLSKQDIIDNQSGLRTYRSRFPTKKTTGGSTGEPVRIWKNANALAHERACTWRAYEWAGVGIGDKQTRFWGIPLASKDQLKAKLIDLIANRRRISAFDLDQNALSRHYDDFIKFRPAYLYGYASVISIFAEYIRDHELSVPKSLKAIVTTSEVLTDTSRKTIEACLSRPVFNEYGCGEVGSIAHECIHGTMHIMADNIYLELDGVEEDKGEIIVTDLHNIEMPLIRYRLGDFASAALNACACGVTFPALSGIHGRAYDMIRTSDGRKLHPEAVMYVFESLQAETEAFRHFQAIQTDLNHFEVKIIPTPHWCDEIAKRLTDMMQRHIHPNLIVQTELVDTIERERSGKLRVIKSLLANATDD